jgi:hypothetical protein
MKYLLIIMSGLEISDGVLTDSLVRGGIAQEANKLMEPLIMGGNFLIFKIAGTVFCAWALWRVYRRYPLATISVTAIITAFYGAVMLWNLGIFFGI